MGIAEPNEVIIWGMYALSDAPAKSSVVLARVGSQWVLRDLQPQETTQKGAAVEWRTSVVVYSLRHTFLTRLGESGCDP